MNKRDFEEIRKMSREDLEDTFMALQDVKNLKPAQASSPTANEYSAKVQTALSTARMLVDQLHGPPNTKEELPALRAMTRHYFQQLLLEQPITNPLTSTETKPQ